MAAVVWASASPSLAQLTSPQVGWQADLSMLAHNVSGTVSILDEDTIQVEDFTYDGLGLSVYFYLGKEQTRDSFRQGLQIGPQLLGTVFTGSEPPLVIDLPAGQTLEGWNAISVWCVTVGSSFGDGTFAPETTPGDFNEDGSVDAADYVAWRDGLGGEYQTGDFAEWRANFGWGAGTAANSLGISTVSVPEPASVVVLSMAVAMLRLRCRYKTTQA